MVLGPAGSSTGSKFQDALQDPVGASAEIAVLEIWTSNENEVLEELWHRDCCRNALTDPDGCLDVRHMIKY
jgi:hypothetical protein